MNIYNFLWVWKNRNREELEVEKLHEELNNIKNEESNISSSLYYL